MPSEPQRVKWRVKLEGDWTPHAPGIGADGTVYVNLSNGKLYAIAPDGTQRWVVQAGSAGAYGPVAVGGDGTIYVAGEVLGRGAIFAFTPTGTQKWVFHAQDYMVAGPNIGPDGNLYAVTDQFGIGLFSLTPEGRLRFSVAPFSDYGPVGKAIAFGSGQLYFGVNMGSMTNNPTLFAYDLNGSKRFEVCCPADNLQAAVGPNGNVVVGNYGGYLNAYSPTGSRAWSFYEWPGNTQTNPDVGPDNVAYTVRNLGYLYAINPDGTLRWRHADTVVMNEPRVRPQNDLVFMGGRISFGKSGFFQAVSTSGTPMWRVDLPDEPGFEPYGQLAPSSRPVFSPDGTTAYGVADVLGDQSPNEYAFLYAIHLGGTGVAAPPGNQPPVAEINGPYSGGEGAGIAFSSAGTSDPNGDALSYLWHFGDGATSTAANPTHAYRDNATYAVKLTVKDPSGATSTASTTATISNVAPTGTFSAPSSITEGTGYTVKISATDAGTADRSTLQLWLDCGQGAGPQGPFTGTSKSLSCAAVPDQDTLTVRARIRDKDGGEQTYSKQLVVKNSIPVVTFGATSSTTISVGGSVSFTGSFTDKGINDMPWRYTINWGDGTTALVGTTSTQGVSISGSHTYSKAGTWYAYMYVKDKDGGGRRSAKITITVNP